MSLSQIFNYIMFYVLIFWSPMILVPNWGITKKLMSSYIFLFPLGILYVYFVWTTGGLDGIISGFTLELAEYQEVFSQEGGALAATIHILALDLFAGRWIYWQGQEKDIFTRHSLFLTIFFGPVGVLSHLITAYFFGKKEQEQEEEASNDVVVS